MDAQTINIPTLLWVADEIAKDIKTYRATKLRNEAYIIALEEVEVMLRATVERVQNGGTLRATSELMASK